MRKIVIITILLTIAVITNAYAGPFARYKQRTEFDQYFQKYTKRNFGPGFNWKEFKSQSIAESALDPKAKSSVGAEGLMQVMPGTWKDVTRKNRYIEGTVYEPRWAIAAGIAYDRQLWLMWKAERPYQDRIDFMMASYNAGAGHIINSQKLAVKLGLNPNVWSSIEETLPEITGHYSKETIGYVRRIKQIKEDI